MLRLGHSEPLTCKPSAGRSIRVLSLSLSYMYTRDNGVPIGLFRLFRLDLQTCFDVLAVRSEVQTQG